MTRSEERQRPKESGLGGKNRGNFYSRAKQIVGLLLLLCLGIGIGLTAFGLLKRGEGDGFGFVNRIWAEGDETWFIQSFPISRREGASEEDRAQPLSRSPQSAGGALPTQSTLPAAPTEKFILVEAHPREGEEMAKREPAPPLQSSRSQKKQSGAVPIPLQVEFRPEKVSVPIAYEQGRGRLQEAESVEGSRESRWVAPIGSGLSAPQVEKVEKNRREPHQVIPRGIWLLLLGGFGAVILLLTALVYTRVRRR